MEFLPRGRQDSVRNSNRAAFFGARPAAVASSFAPAHRGKTTKEYPKLTEHRCTIEIGKPKPRERIFRLENACVPRTCPTFTRERSKVRSLARPPKTTHDLFPDRRVGIAVLKNVLPDGCRGVRTCVYRKPHPS